MASKKKTYPSKKTLNLCVKEKPAIDPVKAIPLVLVVLIAAAAFGKFAVYDRLAEQERVKEQVEAAKATFETLSAEAQKYAGLEKEYEKYSIGWMSENEKNLVLRTDMIDLVNKEIAPSAKISRISMSGNVISVELNGTTLADTSALVATLNQRSDIEKVSVYTASSENKNVKPAKGEKAPEKAAAVSVVITMKNGGAK